MPSFDVKEIVSKAIRNARLRKPSSIDQFVDFFVLEFNTELCMIRGEDKED